jgi:hypothetical protein
MGLLGFFLVLAYTHKDDLPVPLYSSLVRSAGATGVAGVIAHEY